MVGYNKRNNKSCNLW